MTSTGIVGTGRLMPSWTGLTLGDSRRASIEGTTRSVRSRRFVTLGTRLDLSSVSRSRRATTLGRGDVTYPGARRHRDPGPKRLGAHVSGRQQTCADALPDNRKPSKPPGCRSRRCRRRTSTGASHPTRHRRRDVDWAPREPHGRSPSRDIRPLRSSVLDARSAARSAEWPGAARPRIGASGLRAGVGDRARSSSTATPTPSKPPGCRSRRCRRRTWRSCERPTMPSTRGHGRASQDAAPTSPGHSDRRSVRRRPSELGQVAKLSRQVAQLRVVGRLRGFEPRSSSSRRHVVARHDPVIGGPRRDEIRLRECLPSWTVRDGQVVRIEPSTDRRKPSKPPGCRSRRCRRRTWRSCERANGARTGATSRASVKCSHRTSVLEDLRRRSRTPMRARGRGDSAEPQLWAAAFDKLHAEIEEYIEPANGVSSASAHWQGQGKASGISIDVRQFDLYEFRDGRIVERSGLLLEQRSPRSRRAAE